MILLFDFSVFGEIRCNTVQPMEDFSNGKCFFPEKTRIFLEKIGELWYFLCRCFPDF